MLETIRMIANIIRHLRLCYQLLKSRVLVSFGMGDPHQPPVIPAKAGMTRARKCHMALMSFGRSFCIEHTNPLKPLRGLANLKLALGAREC
jgi:hypothetical protein